MDKFYKIGKIRELLRRGNEHDDKFSSDFPNDDSPNASSACLLVIAFDGALLHIPMQERDDFFRPIGMNDTGIDGNNSVASFGIKAHDVFSLFIHADGEL